MEFTAMGNLLEDVKRDVDEALKRDK